MANIYLNKGSQWVLATFVIVLSLASALRSFGVIDLTRYTYGAFLVFSALFLAFEVGIGKGFVNRAKPIDYVTLVLIVLTGVSGILTLAMVSWQPIVILSGWMSLGVGVLSIIYALKK